MSQKPLSHGIPLYLFGSLFNQVSFYIRCECKSKRLLSLPTPRGISLRDAE